MDVAWAAAGGPDNFHPSPSEGTTVKEPDSHEGYRRLDHRPRLDESLYGYAGYPVHVTICAHQRRPIFAKHPEIAQLVMDKFMEAAAAMTIKVYCLCVMPDHLHAVVMVEQGGRNLAALVRGVKTRVTLATRRTKVGPLWHASFHDHIVRDNEGLRATCTYVVNNPVRKGLVRKWEDYPFAWLSDDA